MSKYVFVNFHLHQLQLCQFAFMSITFMSLTVMYMILMLQTFFTPEFVWMWGQSSVTRTDSSNTRSLSNSINTVRILQAVITNNPYNQ